MDEACSVHDKGEVLVRVCVLCDPPPAVSKAENIEEHQ